MNMNTSVDVLSLMQDVMIALEIDNRHEQAKNIALARVLVAELIESADRVQQSSTEESKILSSVKMKRLKDAINRAKGA